MRKLVLTMLALVLAVNLFAADKPTTDDNALSQMSVVIAEDGSMLLYDHFNMEFFGANACTFTNGQGWTYTYWWSTNTGTAYGASSDPYGNITQWSTTIYTASSVCSASGNDGKNGINPNPTDYLYI